MNLFKTKLMKWACSLPLIAASSVVSAAPFDYVFSGTFDSPLFGAVTTWNHGSRDFSFTLTLDNGGTTTLNQTYQVTDVVAYTGVVGDLTFSGIKPSGGLLADGGLLTYSTDALGEFIFPASPSTRWRITDPTGSTFALGQTSLGFAHRPNNGPEENFQFTTSVTTDPGTPSPSGAVPLPGSLLLLAGLLPLLGYNRLRR